MQTEYIGIRRTKIFLHEVSMDLVKDVAGAFFSEYGQVEGVASVRSKISIATGDIIRQVTMSSKCF